MVRPLRIQYPRAGYHVTSRGNARQAIVRDDRDRQSLLDVLASVVGRAKWRCHAYCLMENHYHLLLETLARKGHILTQGQIGRRGSRGSATRSPGGCNA